MQGERRGGVNQTHQNSAEERRGDCEQKLKMAGIFLPTPMICSSLPIVVGLPWVASGCCCSSPLEPWLWMGGVRTQVTGEPNSAASLARLASQVINPHSCFPFRRTLLCCLSKDGRSVCTKERNPNFWNRCSFFLLLKPILFSPLLQNSARNTLGSLSNKTEELCT